MPVYTALFPVIHSLSHSLSAGNLTLHAKTAFFSNPILIGVEDSLLVWGEGGTLSFMSVLPYALDKSFFFFL